MKDTILVITFLAVAIFAMGCTPKDVKAAAAPNQAGPAQVQLDKATAKTKQAAQAMRDYAYAEKTEFVDGMTKALVSTQEELDRLSAKAERAGDAVKTEAKAKLAAAREKWTAAKKQLDRAKTASASDWDDVKNGFKQSYADLRNASDGTRQWLSDKIAP